MTPRGFPNWEALYQGQALETMPWFFADLTPEHIVDLFGGVFDVLSIEHTVYQGNRQPPPRALFCTLVRHERI